MPDQRCPFLVCLAAAVAISACSRGAPPGGASRESVRVDGQEVPTKTLRDALEGLCLALEQAAADGDAARKTFFDRSHEALHIIARAVEKVDRPVAAIVLEAKQEVESMFEGDSNSEDLRTALRRLLGAARAALERLSVKPPQCALANAA